mmetsp:Transcript_17930/g.30501  ORF Transcript_17930/g.30501 Transcript_17930/m.30501 type:complete len:176 (-) Transcript_17930:333-860(-)
MQSTGYNLTINSILLVLIALNYFNFLYFAFLFQEKKEAFEMYQSIVGTLGLEFIGLSVCSVVFILLFSMIHYYQKCMGKESREMNSLSIILFFMIMPFYYSLRMPLLLSLITSVGIIFDQQEQALRQLNYEERVVARENQNKRYCFFLCKRKTLIDYAISFTRENALILNLFESQ